MIRRDRDIAGRDALGPIKEDKGDAAAGIDRCHDERRGGDELELQLRPARDWTPGGRAAVAVLEDDAFGSVTAECPEHVILVLRVECRGHRSDRAVGVEYPQHSCIAVQVWPIPDIDPTHFQQVKGVEPIPDRLTVDETIHRQVSGGFDDGCGQGNDEPAAVDAVDVDALLADEHALAVVLFLEDVPGVAEQTAQVAFLHRVEELRANAAVATFVPGGVVGRALLRRSIAFG
ncbi:hypothetical protein [Luteolibacter sp. Populi]|uniref:hypothetical protein n=1 Tax=Luteolibacter sp. Populi TaxID=3230487 RepID=UPI003466B6ED